MRLEKAFNNYCKIYIFILLIMSSVSLLFQTLYNLGQGHDKMYCPSLLIQHTGK